MNLSKTLISWYLKNKRDLPWRNTVDPYYIWLSEIILQQTQVVQGLPYYEAFVDTYPTVQDLANASEEQVLKLWQGLGYYSRARNLHFTAKYVANELNGTFPKTHKELLTLKGVGEYTASAISSICYQEPKAVVDGNVYRVLARVYGIDVPINTPKGVKLFSELAQEELDVLAPDTHNQAIMEFGARHCTPKKPKCESCVFAFKCVALQEKTVATLPIKLKKITVKKRYFNYIIPIINQKDTLLRRRDLKGIWANLYEFPLVETVQNASENEIVAAISTQKIIKTPFEIRLYNDSPVVHKLTHRHIYAKFWIVISDDPSADSIPIKTLENYPVPVLIANFIKEFSF